MATHTDPHGHRSAGAHSHTDAEGQEHAPEEYDREISLKGVYLTIGGILAVTVVAMVAMWFLSLALIGFGESGDRALMPVEAAQRARTLQLENRLQGGVVLDPDAIETDYDRRARSLGGWVPPGLDETWPSDIELPPPPRVQYSPMNDWLIMKDDQNRRLMAPEDPAVTDRVSIEEAMEYVLAEGLVRGSTHREVSRIGARVEDAAAPTGTQGDGGTPPAASDAETTTEAGDGEVEGADTGDPASETPESETPAPEETAR